MNGDVNTASRIPPESVDSEASPRRRQMLRGNAAARERKSSAGAGSGNTSIVSHGTAADQPRHGANALSVCLEEFAKSEARTVVRGQCSLILSEDPSF